MAIQSRISESFHVDIHPAASFGRGILLDHATGVVIGETAVVGDNVSMLHHVTLGGSGTGKGIRHPTIGHGVLLGAGVSVLGSVTVGCGAKVGAGSVVVTDLPCHSVAVGVPARIVKQNTKVEPCKDMDQTQDFILDYVI
jgi:serine O-acetyltransferase